MIEKNIYFRYVNIYDNDIEVSHALPGQNGCFISRDSYENVLYYNEIPEHTLHPDFPHIHSNLNVTNFFITGNIAVEWEWTETEGYTEEQIDQYINLISNEYTTFTKDLANKRLRLDVVSIDTIQYSDWEFKLIKWNLAAPKFKLIMASDDAEYVCITPNSNAFDYTYHQKTLEPGGTTTIEKLGDVCYVLFTKDMTKGETPLNDFQLYKLTTGDIIVTNSSDTRSKIIRLYK